MNRQKYNLIRTLFVFVIITVIACLAGNNASEKVNFKAVSVQNTPVAIKLRCFISAGENWDSVFRSSTKKFDGAIPVDSDAVLITHQPTTSTNLLSHIGHHTWVYELVVQDIGNHLKTYTVSITATERPTTKVALPFHVLFSGTISDPRKLSECVSIAVNRETELDIPSSLHIATVGTHRFIINVR